MTSTTQTRDGRTLTWAELGDPMGVPVLFLHGTPGGRLGSPTVNDVFRDRGVRLIVPDRAGYGGSDPRPGRTVLSNAEDLVDLLDALALDRVVVAGGSGGGAHALALGVLAPERVRLVGVLFGAVPLTPEEVESQVALNREVLLRLDDEPELRALLSRLREVVLTQGLAGLMPDAPASDQAARAASAQALDAALASAVEPGIEGWYDDYVALWREPWGFAPEQVGVPVVWRHGTADANVPLEAARRVIDRLPDCALQTWEGIGHAPTADLVGEFVDALLAGALR